MGSWQGWVFGGIIDGAIYGGIAGGVAGGLAALILGLVLPSKPCPECGEALPKLRLPRNRQQAMWGGTTCPKCGCAVDRAGKKVGP